MVQVNLGNDETWDTHGNAFPHLKDFLFPPTDRAVSALLDDLHERGLLDSTLVVMASEFGRTPYTSGGPSYKTPGRNHWGGVQSIFLAGGGIQGGQAHGRTSGDGMAVEDGKVAVGDVLTTICKATGIDPTVSNISDNGRPIKIAEGTPIEAILG